MMYRYKGLKYNIGEKVILIFDRNGLMVEKIPVNNKQNHKLAHEAIDKIILKKPKVRIGLTEISPYVWEVYKDGDTYLGIVKQIETDSYMCWMLDNRYDYYITDSIHGVMEYFRKVAKEI